MSGSADKFAKVFDAATGGLVANLEGHTDHVLGVALGTDGGTVATAGSDKTIKLWSLRDGRQLRTIPDHGKQVTGIAFLGLTDELVTSGGDATLRHHAGSTGKSLGRFDGPVDFLQAVAADRGRNLGRIGRGGRRAARLAAARDRAPLPVPLPQTRGTEPVGNVRFAGIRDGRGGSRAAKLSDRHNGQGQVPSPAETTTPGLKLSGGAVTLRVRTPPHPNAAPPCPNSSRSA